MKNTEGGRRQAAVGSQRSEVNALPVPKGVAVDFTVAEADGGGREEVRARLQS